MNATRLHRAVRKLVRPLKRKLHRPAKQFTVADLTGGSLFLLAHPDDEVFCSGLICELRSRGQEVHLVLFTRGEGGERGDTSKDARLSEVREKEMRKAAEILDVTSLTFLDYNDPEPVNDRLAEPTHDSAALLSELEGLFEKYSPAQLFTHGSSGEYWHPAHLCLHRHARILNRRLPHPKLWTFNAWNSHHPLQGVLNQDDPSNLTFDASKHEEQRLQSLASHFSQQAVFQRFSNGSLDDFISLTSRESYRQW